MQTSCVDLHNWQLPGVATYRPEAWTGPANRPIVPMRREADEGKQVAADEGKQVAADEGKVKKVWKTQFSVLA